MTRCRSSFLPRAAWRISGSCPAPGADLHIRLFFINSNPNPRYFSTDKRHLHCLRFTAADSNISPVSSPHNRFSVLQNFRSFSISGFKIISCSKWPPDIRQETYFHKDSGFFKLLPHLLFIFLPVLLQSVVTVLRFWRQAVEQDAQISASTCSNSVTAAFSRLHMPDAGPHHQKIGGDFMGSITGHPS